MKVCTFIFFSFNHDMIKAVIVMKKILIVEDDQSIASSLKEMLEKKGYFIEIAESKKETLKKVNEYVDLILLDIQLPDGNGIDLCKEIKEKYEIPIIFLSCLNDEETIVRGLNEGGDDYVCKPFGIKELCARIECNLRKVTKQQGVYYIDDLIIDTLKHKVFQDNKKQHLIAALANINNGNIENIPKRYKLNEEPRRSIIITFNYDENLKKGKYKAIRITPNLLEIESDEWNGK